MFERLEKYVLGIERENLVLKKENEDLRKNVCLYKYPEDRICTNCNAVKINLKSFDYMDCIKKQNKIIEDAMSDENGVSKNDVITEIKKLYDIVDLVPKQNAMSSQIGNIAISIVKTEDSK